MNYMCVMMTALRLGVTSDADVLVSPGRMTDAANLRGLVWTLRTSGAPGARWGHAMAYDSGREATVLFGGGMPPSTPYLGDTWEWNGSAWMQKSSDGPSGRWAHAMAYDAARGVTVLFGGFNTEGRLDDTWTWDGVTWTSKGAGPSARWGHAMAYDSCQDEVVLFGGDTGTANGETWIWNGTTWSEEMVVGPSPRRNSAMAFDSTRCRAVLFGGDVSVSQAPEIRNGETWEWDGKTRTWELRSSNGPSPRRDHKMAYDAARNVTVLFGGSPDGPVSGETWEWDGVTWSRGPTGPSPRIDAVMTYDSARQVVVLFGGNDAGGGNDETWEYGPSTIPTVSEWGLLTLSLLILVCGTIVLGMRQKNAIAECG